VIPILRWEFTHNCSGNFRSACTYQELSKRRYSLSLGIKYRFSTSLKSTTNFQILLIQKNSRCRDSSVGIATDLRVGRSGDRIPVGARFSAPVQIGPVSHLAYYTMGNGSFPGVKRPERGVEHPLHFCRGWRKSRAILPLPFWTFVASYRVKFTFTFSFTQNGTYYNGQTRHDSYLLAVYRNSLTKTDFYVIWVSAINIMGNCLFLTLPPPRGPASPHSRRF